METPETIVQPTATPAPAAKPSEAAPWVQNCPEPLSVRTATARLDRPVETVHWSVVALTVFTAIGVMFGAYGRNSHEPRELLPIMVYKAR
jgi:hypothetical protein